MGNDVFPDGQKPNMPPPNAHNPSSKINQQHSIKTKTKTKSPKTGTNKQQLQSQNGHSHSHLNAPKKSVSTRPNNISPAFSNTHKDALINKQQKQSSSNYENSANGFQLNKKMSLNDFELNKLIGKGSFGQVWQVTLKKSKQIYALKILKKKDLVARKQVVHTNTERRILANIDHPFLVSLRYAFQTKTKLFMVMDFFNGGELFFHIQNEGKFEEKRAKFYCAEICLAIECLHKNEITYRDLKPENILLDHDGHIKLTDFGLSKECISSDPECITRTFCGSPEYLGLFALFRFDMITPEMLHQNGYNQMVDWWSFGTILYEMICGLPPFYDQNIQKMYQNILYAKIPFYHFMSRSVIELISKLLIKDPLHRIKCREIKKSLFFGGMDWNKLYNKEIEPPFKPKVKGKSDTTNFQIPKSSRGKEKIYLDATPSFQSGSLLAVQGKFQGFTFDETTDNLAKNKENNDDILYID